MRPLAPSLRRMITVMAVMSLALACEKQPAQDGKATPDAAAKQSPQADPDADPGADDNEATFAKPTAEPPPAPAGSVALRDPWLYVQTCAAPHPCPELLQPAGDAHCRELELNGHVNWRLPTKDEVLRFEGLEGLEAADGYHWTRTPYEDDMAQVWIVDFNDPQAAPATTIPRDRKPFRIRCVKEP
jgi:hypothetical protein